MCAEQNMSDLHCMLEPTGARTVVLTVVVGMTTGLDVVVVVTVLVVVAVLVVVGGDGIVVAGTGAPQ